MFVVNGKNDVEAREVRLGLRQGDLVVVEEGLKATDWVVFSGQHRLRAGMTVKPKKVTIPSEKK